MTALEATPATVRPAFATLWNLDLALAAVVSTTSDPRLGAIRLAWWRERLEELDTAAPPSEEPRLRAIARQLIARGISGNELSRLEDSWLPLLNPFPWGEPEVEGLRLRGRVLFGIGARLLGADAEDGTAAGALWSLVDGAEHCSDPQTRHFLLGEARHGIRLLPPRAPPEIRSLTVLAALAAHDMLRTGNLRRVGAALTHRLRGTFPHG